jgi:hypothetical protein
MRRTLPARAGVALLAVSFLLVVNGPAALYQCPAHSPRAASGQAPMAHHGAHAHHGAPAEHHAPQITCGGICCCTPAAGAPLVSVGAEWLPSVRLTPAAEIRHAARSAEWPLPFATGPPHTA